MSTLATTNIKHGSSSSNNIVLDSNGKAIMPGHIIQVVTAVATNTVSTTSTSYVETTSDLRCTITPISATSKLIITYSLYLNSVAQWITVRLRQDGSTELTAGDNGHSTTGNGNASFYGDNNPYGTLVTRDVVTASNTSQRYYSPFWRTNGGTVGLNRIVHSADYADGISVGTIMEVAV